MNLLHGAFANLNGKTVVGEVKKNKICYEFFIFS